MKTKPVIVDPNRNIENAIKCVSHLMQSTYLPQELMDHLQILINAATAWQLMQGEDE